MPQTKRYVITGGPATGKTTILNELQARQYRCMPEFSRHIIQQELANGTNILPWADLTAFTKKVIAGRIQQYQDAQPGIQFYDRGVVDSLAYIHHDNLPVLDEWNMFLENNRYEETVFITEPWRAIFETDNERKESWDKLVRLHDFIVSTYQNWGYNIIVVPQKPVVERAEFILDSIL